MRGILMTVLLTALLFASIGCATAAPLQEVWNKTYGGAGDERINLVLQTDGGYLIAGRIKNCDECTTDVWLVKIDSNGNEEWNRTFEKTHTDWLNHILLTSDGGYIVAGTTRLYGIKKSEIRVIKIDSNGDEQWNRTYGEGVIEWKWFFSQTLDDDCFIGVTTSPCDDCPNNILLAKINPDGVEQWNRTIGGYEDDRLMHIDQTSDGAFIIVRINGSLPDYDKWIEKIDANGTVQWCRSLGEGSVSQVQRTSDGGYIIATRSTYYSRHSNLMLIKTDSKGNEQWNKTFSGTLSWSVNSIRETWDGGYIMGGETYSFGVDHPDFWVMKTDPQGEEQWTWTLIGISYKWIDSVHQTTDGSFIAIGEIIGSTYVLMRFDPDGNLQWNKEYEDVEYFQHTSDGGYILAGDKEDYFWLIKIREELVPAALFSYNPQYPGVAQTIVFDATTSFSPGGNITIYQWNFGDGNITITTEGTITHSYTSDGNYTVNLTVHGIDNLVNSTTREVTVQKTAPPEVEWMQTFGGNGHEKAYCVRQTLDSGYVVAGKTRTNDFGELDFWLVKTDPNGTEQWNRTYGGTDSDSGYFICQTFDRGYIVAGNTRSYGAGNSDFWLVKINPDGDEQWNKTFGGTDFEGANFVQQTWDGGYIIRGDRVNNSGHSIYWLVKTDPGGNEEWNRTLGNYGGDRADAMQLTSDGGFILAGRTHDHSDGSFGIWLIRTDSSGNEQWTRTIGGIEEVGVKTVLETSDCGFIITGSTGSYYGDDPTGILLVKVDANGYEEWNMTFTGIDYYTLISVVQTSDRGYIVAGIKETREDDAYFGDISDVWLIKTDSNGNIQWYNGLGGTGRDQVEFVQQTSDGGYIITGTTDSYGAGGSDFWLVKVAGMETDAAQSKIRLSDNNVTESLQTLPGKSIPGFEFVGAIFSVLLIMLPGRRIH
jgi:PKD repeat protein